MYVVSSVLMYAAFFTDLNGDQKVYTVKMKRAVISVKRFRLPSDFCSPRFGAVGRV